MTKPKPLTDPHLYPLTLAFHEGLAQGTVTLDNAWEFCDRVYASYLAECVKRRTEPGSTRHFGAVKGLLPAKKDLE